MSLRFLAKMFDNKRYKRCAIVCCIMSFMLIWYIIYVYHSDYSSPTVEKFVNAEITEQVSRYNRVFDSKNYRNEPQEKTRDIPFREYDFDIESNEVIIFLHIQKTGGTVFGKHLVTHLDVEIPCECQVGRKRCKCVNSKHQIWLVSRYSTGWLCGLHADWTELHECVNDALDKKEVARHRKYLYITMLRDPVARYLSEWMHVARGATWIASHLRCNGHVASLDEVPLCYEGSTWSGVTLEEFMSCKHNLAHNRQTRMLADLTLVNCYNRSGMSDEQRNQVILESAKQSLASMAFFGLTEYQMETQWLFERTFNLRFMYNFKQFNETHASGANVTSEQKQELLKVNSLDIELYKYARDLFFQRLEYMSRQSRDYTRKNVRHLDKVRHDDLSRTNLHNNAEEAEDDDAADYPDA